MTEQCSPSNVSHRETGTSFAPVSASYVDTIAAMTALAKATIAHGAMLTVLGYDEAGDGGGGVFRWDATSAMAANGGTVFTANEGGAGRWLRVLTGKSNPRWWGAKGNKVHDDTAALQAAIDLAQTFRGQVEIPSAQPALVYRITAPLKITGPVRIVGENLYSSIIYASGLTAGQVAIDIDGTVNPNLDFVEMSGLTVMSDNHQPDLIRINRASFSAFRDIALRNGRHGIVITGNRTFSHEYQRIIHAVALTGSTVKFENFTGGGQFTFTACSFGGLDGVYVDGNSETNAISFFNCNFEQCATTGFYAGGTVLALSFFGCRTEKCGGFCTFLINPIAGKKVLGLSIKGCFFNTDREAYPINLGGAGGTVRGFDISGNYMEHYTTGLVRLNGEGESGVISGNYLNRAGAHVVNVARAGVKAWANEGTSGKFADIA